MDNVCEKVASVWPPTCRGRNLSTSKKQKYGIFGY